MRHNNVEQFMNGILLQFVAQPRLRVQLVEQVVVAHSSLNSIFHKSVPSDHLLPLYRMAAWVPDSHSDPFPLHRR